MLIGYNDVRSRIPQEPKWYTPNGYPRYCEFSPQETGVYVRSELLVRIACQYCHQEFLVGAGWNDFNFENLFAYTKIVRILGTDLKLTGEQISELCREDIVEIAKNYHYGDPPPHGCVGDTMSCYSLEIVEAWERDPIKFGWNPIFELIGPLQDPLREE